MKTIKTMKRGYLKLSLNKSWISHYNYQKALQYQFLMKKKLRIELSELQLLNLTFEDLRYNS